MCGIFGGQSDIGIGFPPNSSVFPLTIIPPVGTYAYFLWPIPCAVATFYFDYSAIISCKFICCAPEECLKTLAVFIYSSVYQFFIWAQNAFVIEKVSQNTK
jgi:hypothetical protein